MYLFVLIMNIALSASTTTWTASLPTIATSTKKRL